MDIEIGDAGKPAIITEDIDGDDTGRGTTMRGFTHDKSMNNGRAKMVN